MTAHSPGALDLVTRVFREARLALKPQQGEERETLVQVILIGDVALVGVPAEFFTVLGMEIKRRSPFPDTYVAELANDWIGYLPDREAHRLGGYQTWTGFAQLCRNRHRRTDGRRGRGDARGIGRTGNSNCRRQQYA